MAYFTSMFSVQGKQIALGLVFSLLLCPLAHCSDLDDIGITLLRATTTNLTGSGIRVAQPEAGDPLWEVNPAAVGQPESLFTWTSTNGTATNFPNSVGSESSHADGVGYNFYGTYAGVAPGVSHVDSYEAEYFFDNFIQFKTSIPAKVVNQSFIFPTSSDDATIEQSYDDYIAQYGTIFCSGVGNGGPVSPPGTSYNGIGVGVFGASSSYGPTTGGRSKPEIIAPGGATSFSAPYVSGAATLLLQAAGRGDGGTNIAAVSDARTVKALLLNGAIKPSNWTHAVSAPFDTNYGAGVLNVFNSYHQMTSGQQPAFATTTVTTGNPHPPSNPNGYAVSLSGWDFRNITNTAAQDTINHYFFNLPSNSGNAYILTSTLVWQRHQGRTNINDLDLFLYDIATSNLVASSISTVDNLEHFYLPQLPAGRYDLQVVKNGSSKRVTSTETYALAYEIIAPQLTINHTSTNLTLSWPVYPAGFVLESTTNLAPPIVWTQIASGIVTNNLNQLTVSAVNKMTYYRLRR